MQPTRRRREIRTRCPLWHTRKDEILLSSRPRGRTFDPFRRDAKRLAQNARERNIVHAVLARAGVEQGANIAGLSWLHRRGIEPRQRGISDRRLRAREPSGSVRARPYFGFGVNF
jgi:hypothetical protein